MNSATLRKFPRAYRALAQSGLFSPIPLLALVQLLLCWLRFGGSVYMVAAWGAWRFPNRTALIEPGQEVTYRQLVARADRLAGALEQGFSPRTVGILGRNRIAYVESLLACARLGADTVLLNPMSGPQQLQAFCAARSSSCCYATANFGPGSKRRSSRSGEKKGQQWSNSRGLGVCSSRKPPNPRGGFGSRPDRVA